MLDIQVADDVWCRLVATSTAASGRVRHHIRTIAIRLFLPSPLTSGQVSEMAAKDTTQYVPKNLQTHLLVEQTHTAAERQLFCLSRQGQWAVSDVQTGVVPALLSVACFCLGSESCILSCGVGRVGRLGLLISGSNGDSERPV